MSRMDRVNQQIKREISLIIQQELADPRVEFVSITECDVSKDLRNAKIMFSVLGDQQRHEEAQKGLDGARGKIRRLVGQRMKIRYTPELSFHYDKTVEESARIDQTLKEIHDEYKQGHTDDQET